MSITDPHDLSDLFEKTSNDRGTPTPDALAALLEAVAACDGIALVDDLISEGHSPLVIRQALSPGEDKRVRPRLTATAIGQWRLLLMTSSGWAAVSQPNRRGSTVSQNSARHRLAPATLRRALEQHVVPLARERGVLMEVITGTALRAYCEERRGEAWSLIKGGGGAQDQADASVVLSGVLPDALVVETWHEASRLRRPAVWPSVGDAGIHVEPAPAEFITAIEIELSAKNTTDGVGVLGHKVRRGKIAMSLGWWAATCYVVSGERNAEVTERLRRVGAVSGAGHYLLNASECGIGGEAVIFPEGAREPWWSIPLRNAGESAQE